MISILNNIVLKKVKQVGKRRLNELIATAEQLMFDRKTGVDSIGAYMKREANSLLTKLHKDANIETQSFSDYLTKLTPIQEGGGAYGHDLYDMMSEINEAGDPTAVLEKMVETEIAERASNSFVGEAENVVLPDGFFKSELVAAELLNIPNNYLLKAHEYNNIRQYFHTERSFADLSAREQTLVESLRWSPEQFGKNFGIDEQPLYHELRMQLEDELVQSGDVSLAEIKSMKNVDVPFEMNMQTYSVETMMAEGYVNRNVPEGTILSDSDYIAAARQDRLLGEQSLREMVHEYPEMSNRELITKFQNKESFEELVGSNIGDPDARFKYYYDLFDEERAGVDLDLNYALRAPEGTRLVNSEQAQKLVETMEAEFTEPELMNMLQFDGAGNLLFEEGTMTRWLNHQTENLKVAPVAMFVLGKIGEWNPEAAKYINIGLSVFDLMMSGDPTGVIVNLAGMVFDEFNNMSQKRIANQTPDSWSGSRFGYVRRGGKYVPAILREVEDMWGFAQTERTMKMEFADVGGELRWVFDGEGNLSPQFSKPLEETFHTTINEMTNQYSLEYLQNNDALRSWYLVSPEDQTSIVNGSQAGAAWGDMPVDISKITDPYFNRLENWRRVLDSQSDYRLEERSKVAERTVIQDYPTSRGLHEQYLRSKGHGVDVEAERFGNYMGVGHDWIANEHKNFLSNHNPENNYILYTVFHKSLEDLVRTQRIAAREEGYDDLFELEPGWTEGGGMTSWSAAFSDPDHEFPVAGNAGDLQGQIDEIKAIPDYTKGKRDFLVQKAVNRYWLGQITALGGGNDIMDYIEKPNFDDQKMEGNFPTSWIQIYKGKEHIIKDDNGYNLLHLGGRRTETPIPMPWLNEGESFLIDPDVELSATYQNFTDEYHEAVQPFKDDWYDLTKPKADPAIAGVLVKDSREFFYDKKRGQQIMIDGVWRNLVGWDMQDDVTILTFDDGTQQRFDESRYGEHIRVREVDPDYFEQPEQWKTDKVQEILDTNPEITKSLK